MECRVDFDELFATAGYELKLLLGGEVVFGLGLAEVAEEFHETSGDGDVVRTEVPAVRAECLLKERRGTEELVETAREVSVGADERGVDVELLNGLVQDGESVVELPAGFARAGDGNGVGVERACLTRVVGEFAGAQAPVVGVWDEVGLELEGKREIDAEPAAMSDGEGVEVDGGAQTVGESAMFAPAVVHEDERRLGRRGERRVGSVVGEEVTTLYAAVAVGAEEEGVSPPFELALEGMHV